MAAFDDEILLDEGNILLPQADVVLEDLPIEGKDKLALRRMAEDGNEELRHVDESESGRFAELCDACRRGDLTAVDTMVTNYGVNINAIDDFDYSPLILASLCGHEEVVKYLLQKGAICDRDTFQGERCLYGALNNRIRRILLQFDFTRAIDESQPFASHIASLLVRTSPETSDIIFRTAAGAEEMQEFHLHRFILAARTAYFDRSLRDRWEGKTSVRLTEAMDPAAFEAAIGFVYVGFKDTGLHLYDRIKLLSRKLEIPEIMEVVDSQLIGNHRRRRNARQEEVRTAQADFETFVDAHVLRNAISLPCEQALSFQMTRNNDGFADILLRVDQDDGACILYPAHKALLIRTEYFFAMFSGFFMEAHGGSTTDCLPIIPLHVKPSVAPLVLRFLYCDRVDVPLENALDCLYAADHLLMERLKALASIVITTQMTSKETAAYSIYDVMHAAWETRSERLEQFVSRYIAHNLESVIADPEFAELVLESASAVKSREETDTIVLIDEIRFYLAEMYWISEKDADQKTGKVPVEDQYGNKASYIEREYNEKLDLLESLLDKLELDI